MKTKTLSRREMLRRSATFTALSGAQLVLPRWMPRLSFAPKYRALPGDVLVVVFLRGGADSLNMIVPHGEEAYYTARPQLAIPRPDDGSSQGKILDLDGFFGLHPSLSPLLPVFQNGELTAVHATGSPDPTRSHFTAMDFMERGTPGSHDLSTGWIGRHLGMLDTGNQSPLRGVGWGTAAQSALRGPVSPVAMKSIADYHLGGRLDLAEQMMQSINALYNLDSEALSETANATQAAVEIVQKVDIDQYQPQNGAQYPEDEFAFALKQTAALIREEVGLEAACVDLGGWDTHSDQGTIEGTQANLMLTLANGLAAFHADMGPQMSRITVVVMSEFGRRVKENASFGTDHGNGGAILVMNGDLAQGPVVADWPGLSEEVLDRGDLAITIDYRDVLSEVISLRLNNPAVSEVFPNFSPNMPGLFTS